jgi:hypothetical protein
MPAAPLLGKSVPWATWVYLAALGAAAIYGALFVVLWAWWLFDEFSAWFRQSPESLFWEDTFNRVLLVH